ncbi:ABC-2 type transporter [Segniliparus rotundus DSM 44985]|uniref:ABC-2 type transporter n=1 Tax=Segniliparus rotundus (strain ATCC BAA-972 / CDC 1076 / CIP 108378 / DSM 44985 / JCM 13578) TaxID=640132 RepID=D6ZBP8_SEGRD|nr:ABC transporter permease [Segniliparus rotundus]ADG96875.1 ABC-2 type transporter [Segniliparus rotundus DSM 44985]
MSGTAAEHGFAPARASSRSFSRAWDDLRRGVEGRELWLQLGWQDIKQRYRRSVLGPFWITISTGTIAICLALLYSMLLGQDLRDFLPHVTVGLIIWNLIQNSVEEGSEVFIVNEGLIKQLPAPISIHIYRLIWRQALLMAHNLVIYVILIAVFPPRHWSWSMLLAFPALALLLLNAVWVAMVAGVVATRFRDVVPMVSNITQLLFYLTPIVWTTQGLTKQGGAVARRARLVEINPLYHYVDILRAPMIGAPQAAYHWWIVIALTAAGFGCMLVVMRQYRSRVAYWV